MRATLILLLALPLGCVPRVPDHGTFVGNPGSSLVRVASGTGLDFTELALSDGLLVPADCVGADGPSEAFADVDLDTPLLLPEGAWCELGLVFGGDSHFEAEGSDGGTLQLDLELTRIDLVSEVAVDLGASAWVLELAEAGWVSADELGVSDGSDVFVGPHEPAGEAASDQIRAASALYRDADRDGEIGADERLAGPAMLATIGR